MEKRRGKERSCHSERMINGMIRKGRDKKRRNTTSSGEEIKKENEEGNGGEGRGRDVVKKGGTGRGRDGGYFAT